MSSKYVYGQYKDGKIAYSELPLKNPVRYDIIKQYYRIINSNGKQTHLRKVNAGVSKAAKRQKPGAGRARQGWVYAGGRRVVTVPNAVGGRLAHPPGPKKRRKNNIKLKKRAIVEIYKSMFDTKKLKSRPKLNTLNSNCIVVPDNALTLKFKSIKKIANDLQITQILRSKMRCNIFILGMKNQLRT